ncbi:NAD(P)/FAD-dependent oxidoreductase [Kribbella sp. NBC_01245]|uniref:bifunctional NAD(P)/FAD-dependent oxidoreductase/class I SAM-dependent methyltransferase n=1 Tax=Kribbella sp. NBC_01245 TaxID=2903578 RepID=UPI002E2E3326|nr:bifunctional NAD(P)/FAD-dependent oxidoreductase/class I SAM-dependent methyltransferase [Kribbella sp. NBC_01245]
MDKYDVVVVGGGAAGLAGAQALARFRRRVLVIDSGRPRNAPAEGVHNFLGHDGRPPGELLALGRKELEQYGAEVRPGEVTTITQASSGFKVTLADQTEVEARRLLVTTGLVDELPDITGLAEQWGRGVLHCPYCHGWEVRDQAIGVIATSLMALHQADLFRQLSDNVTLFLHTAPEPSDEEWERLAARGISVVTGEVEAVESTDGRITGVRLTSGKVIPRQALVVAPRFTARADVLTQLGLEPVEMLYGDHVVGTYIPSGQDGATTVPGVWIAGNVADLRAQVVSSAAAGLSAGAAINMDLIAEETREAVNARSTKKNVFDEAYWEERYGSSEKVWSGKPNPQLVTEATPLTPGTALDVGCGEGADAIWLASQGWQVTAVDFSTVALKRAAEHAGDLKIDWQHVDVTDWQPDHGRFDLVSAQFMHLPREPREILYAKLAEAVAPGGSLLIVAHHPRDLETNAPRPNLPDMFFTAEELAAELDPAEWEIATHARPREAVGREGESVTIHDTVLHARKR